MGKILADIEQVVQFLIVLTTILPAVNNEYCPGHGSACPPPQQCCHGGSMCCTLSDPKQSREDDFHGYDSDLQFGIWNLWYFWFVVIFLFMACAGACAFWRHRRRLLMAEQAALATVSFGSLVSARRAHCPPSQLSSEPSRNSLNRFSYFSTVLASSPSTQEPHGEFPSPPPYSEIATKSSEVPSNTYSTDLPPYCSGYGLNLQHAQPGGHHKGVHPTSESPPCRGISNLPTAPPSYSVLSSAISPPTYTVNSSQNRSAASYPSLRPAPSVDSGDELIPGNTDRRPNSPP